MTKFRATPVEERNLIVRIQDKGNNFVFLDNEADAHKVSEQMSKGSFRILDHDITNSTCSEVLEWAERWKL